MSASCTSLPVYDVLHELIQNGTHSCNLVELQEAEANVTFRAASFLDDYIFRPSSLDRMNIYEFAMACFRRKQSKSAATTDLILPGHPLFNTHCIGHHQTEAVPVITGVRMPSSRTAGPDRECTARAAIDLANGDHELALSVAELQEWVKDLTIDEAELPPAGLTRDERSADVIELIQSALKSDREWSPPNQQHDWPPPTPLRPYPSISDFFTAFTLKRRQHTAFSFVARVLLRRFQQQERANVHKLLTIALATSSPDYETTSCSCSLVVPVAPARVV
ncbi:hypothetical protein L914_19263 [Phytophthora nicotianae]|uniref:Uncharacterized protein n=1 Tax=Phytophthora nicotianae TaxID=4792 RepID=W2MAX6_PHYNI|nr:hypothetical protein L914_19263 [Phytophthora nicotianae]